MTFTRFVVGTNAGAARDQSGVVTELRILKESGELPDYELEQIEALFAWLNEHLPVPPFDEAEWPRDAVSWFKPDALDIIFRFREMIAVLEAHGRFVRTLRTDDPGVIRYEDKFQVVASSFRF